jgi:bifunctional non-homologous end joining protein LigD
MLKLYPDGPALTALVQPIQAKEAPVLPRGEDWVYEFLWAGERVRAVKRADGVHLFSREGKDITNRFPRIAASVAKLRANHAILDGEILYLDSYAEPAVRFLERAADDLSNTRLALLAYDLLCDEGRDVRHLSLLCRRLLLVSLVQGTPIIVSPLLSGPSEHARAMAVRLGMRGVLAKRCGSAYRPNALSCDWMKVTLTPPGSRNPFQARLNDGVKPLDFRATMRAGERGSDERAAGD